MVQLQQGVVRRGAAGLLMTPHRTSAWWSGLAVKFIRSCVGSRSSAAFDGFQFIINTPMTILTKIILTAVGTWFTSLVLLFIFPTILPVLSGFAILLSMPIALILVTLTLATLIKSRKRFWPVLCFVLIIAVSYFALRQVTYWGALAHLYLNRRSYETTAARMLAARDEAERQRVCGERCWLLSDNPGRVAL